MQFGGIWCYFFQFSPSPTKQSQFSTGWTAEASSDTIKISHYKSLEWTSINQTHSIFLEAKWVPAEGKCWDWHLPEMDHQVLQPHSYGPGNCEVKDVSFSPLVFLFHHSAGHCPSPAAGLLYSGSYRAPYHLAFCRQVPCFPLGTSPSAIDFSKSG